MWPQPCAGKTGWVLEESRGWVTEGLVNHIGNFGYLKDVGRPSTGCGLGVARSGACFERVFLLVAWRMATREPRVETRNLSYNLYLSTCERHFFQASSECLKRMLEMEL